MLVIPVAALDQSTGRLRRSGLRLQDANANAEGGPSRAAAKASAMDGASNPAFGQSKKLDSGFRRNDEGKHGSSLSCVRNHLRHCIQIVLRRRRNGVAHRIYRPLIAI